MNECCSRGRRSEGRAGFLTQNAALGQPHGPPAATSGLTASWRLTRAGQTCVTAASQGQRRRYRLPPKAPAAVVVTQLVVSDEESTTLVSQRPARVASSRRSVAKDPVPGVAGRRKERSTKQGRLEQ